MAELIDTLAIEGKSKIVFFIMDGLGGLPKELGGKTELETANTPNLDALAKESLLGLNLPMGRGITPGSAPGHFSLFGYDPVQYQIGRGVVAACGIGFPLKPGDLAARINFASMDENGNITDRRAGRIKNDVNEKLCEKLKAINIPGYEVFVKTVKDHRAVVVFRGENLKENLADTDPQATGVPALECKATSDDAQHSADIANEFVKQAREILKDERPANMVLMRGFAETVAIPSFMDRYKLKAACLAVYPDYKGISNLVGMDIVDCGENIDTQMETLKKVWNDYDFFFVHHKYTDSFGEDGNFDGKVKTIEDVDQRIPKLMDLNPDVLVITGDHSTPAVLSAHSWHPVPLLLKTQYMRLDDVQGFGERECAKGSIGIINGTDILTLAMAYAGRMNKFGA